jgi:glycosyltransferase involved in cell wall biosynthesis
MPVFNGQAYLHSAIESILGQSCEDFEFIIIDDGSTDNTAQIVRQFQAVDGRIIFISRENKGLSRTLNDGIDLASGTWIARMDADDVSLFDRFEKQLLWLKLTGADICGSWIECFGGGSTSVYRHPQTDDAIRTGFLFGCLLAHPTVIVKASLMKALKYDSYWNRAEDYELWTRMALAGAKFTNISEVLLRYRVHSSQVSIASSTEQKILSQNIRKNYWKLSPIVKKIDENLVQEFLKLYDPELASIDMDDIDQCMTDLLTAAEGESQLVVHKYGELAYAKACRLDRSAPRRWKTVCKNFGLPCPVQIQALMIIASTLKVRNNGALLKMGKFCYSFFSK